MKFKKLICIGIAIVMTVSALAACGSTSDGSANSGSTDKSQIDTSTVSAEVSSSVSSEVEEAKGVTFPLDETMTFTGFSMMNMTYKLSEALVIQKTLEDANIILELTEVPSSEVAEKGNLLMASGDYPDMLLKSNLDCEKYGMEGLLIPLENLIREYAPNLSAILDENNLWSALASPDGHIYSFPRIRAAFVNGSNTAWINKKWLDNLGLKEPTNMEELYEVLKAFADEDANGNGDPNDEIPYTFNTTVPFWALDMFNPAGLLDVYSGMSIMDDGYTFWPVTEEYKETSLAYYAKMYEDGILDPQGFTQSQEQMCATGATSDVYGMFIYPTPKTVVGEERTLDYITLKPFDGGDTLPLNRGISMNGMAITDKCEHPEVLVSWIDYFYGEEGSVVGYLGYEGITYEMDEEGYWSFIDPDAFRSFTLFGACPSPQLIPDIINKVDAEVDPVGAHENNQYYFDLCQNYGTVLPTIKFNDDENIRLSDLKPDITSYWATYAAEIAIGEKSLDDTWEGYCQTMTKMGIKEYEKIYQDAYARTQE